MRFLLNIIFLFFVVIIAIEDAVVEAITSSKPYYKKCKRFFLAFSKICKRKFYAARHASHHFFHHTLLRRWKMIRRKTKIIYFAFGVTFSFLFLFVPLVGVVFVQDLPSPQELTYRQIPQTTKIFDRNGILLAEFYSIQNRTLIHLSDVPLSLQHATLAIEDKNFYNHPGFDIPSIVRAFSETVFHKHLQGGSTITQQLIKSSLLTPEQSISRKIKEIVLAFWAERLYSKKQILEMYFNQVPYGGLAWGVEAASETYFSKPVKDLSLAQSAFLAGLTAAPTNYSPYGSNPNSWKKRQHEVLDRMLTLGYITKKQELAAEKEKLTFKYQQTALHAPHFVQYVRDLLVTKYGLAEVEKGGLQVKTSLDLKTQEMVEQVVKHEVAQDGSLNLTNGAALVTSPKNGDVLAMVGSHDFNDPNGGNVNLANSLRQPGSSIKVVTYSAALTHGFTAASMLADTPVSFPSDSGVYSPVNYDGRFHGQVSLRTALANSFNIPAVKTLNQIGIPTMVDEAKKMGIGSWGNANQYGLSLTLGAAEVTMLDMASVYGTLANNGRKEDIYPILKITDVKGNTLEQKTPNAVEQVIPKGVAFIMSDILADNQARSLEFGINSPLTIPNHEVSVKTGTTDSKRDNWTDGYTDDFVVVVWVGNNDNTPMNPALASGITGAAPIWHQIMANLLTKKPETKPLMPTDIVQRICFGKPEYFLRGTENSVLCGFITPPSSAYTVR